MSGTYGFAQTPLKSTLPEGRRGVGPAGGWYPRCAAATAGNTTIVARTASRLAATRRVIALSYCFGGGGLSPPDDPAKTLRPSASLTTRALQVFDPSFASTPSIVISSPIFREFGPQPLRVSVLGGPPSHCQGCGPPLSSFTSRYTQMCGFAHSTFVTAPFSVMGLFASNSAAKEWCVDTGCAMAATRPAPIMKGVIFIARLHRLPRQE